MTAVSEVAHVSSSSTDTVIKAAVNTALTALAPDSDDRVVVVWKDDVIVFSKYQI